MILTWLVRLIIGWFKPNTKQDQRIMLLEECVKRLDSSMKLVKENHLPHIETALGNINIEVATIKTILKERLPSKSGNGFK